jgi:trans-2-enoyl-CoA reductase
VNNFLGEGGQHSYSVTLDSFNASMKNQADDISENEMEEIEEEVFSVSQPNAKSKKEGEIYF